MGLPAVGMAVMYEEANRSIFGPVVLQRRRTRRRQHDAAGQGRHAGPAGRWLQPIVDGAVRSAFAMTEPAPGGGSDPGMIRTRAERTRRRLGDRRAASGSSPAPARPSTSS